MEPEHLQHLDLIRSEYLHRKHSRIEGHIFYSENANNLLGGCDPWRLDRSKIEF